MTGEYIEALWHDGRRFLARLDPKYNVAVIVRPEIEMPGSHAGHLDGKAHEIRRNHSNTNDPRASRTTN